MKQWFSKYKRKFYAVLGGSIIVLILCWNLAISQTFDNYKQISLIQKNVSKYKNPEQRISDLQKEFKNISSQNMVTAEDIDELIMETISSSIRKYGIELEKIPETITKESQSYSIQTYSLTFSGKYIPLVKYTDFLENELTYGKIISANFSRTVQRKKGEKLYLELYYQVIFNKTEP